MTEKKHLPIAIERSTKGLLTSEQYHHLYKHSITDPPAFWSEQAKQFISWSNPWATVIEGDFSSLNVTWFKGGKLNACYNCVDRHLITQPDKVALIWEGNEPSNSLQLTYTQLHKKICKLANVLKSLGVKKGERVCIYLPMIPEAIIAMLACARIGAIHTVVFGGFSSQALKTRLLDADCCLLITADQGLRGTKIIPFKDNCDKALKDCPNVKHVIVVKHTGNPTNWTNARDIDYQEATSKESANCPIEDVDATEPLFILYTSGSTGTPKGVLHSTGGYLVYVAMSHHYVFNYRQNDIHWCTADIGWITGHSYLVYGPLANGATTLMFEGVPDYPTASRFWQIIDKHRVTIFYTAPTAIRALRREGDEWVLQNSRKSLRLLGTVGEPINPDVWEWYFNVVGNKQCFIVDTWWQTETGGILLSPLAGVTDTPPGSAGVPFFGVVPEIIDDNGKPIDDGQHGKLVIKQPWPGLMQTIYGNRNRFIGGYFKDYPGVYLTGDGAYRGKDGNFWITGRQDDVMNVSGHRIGTAEVESALLTHKAISEAAVVGIPDTLTNESIYAFVTTKSGVTPCDDLKHELIQQVRNIIGAFAKPQQIQWANSLPKTRSGKIMRRLLRKIASNEMGSLGDTSTLADEHVLEELIKGRG